jgi:preprotein translocase subunit SecA
VSLEDDLMRLFGSDRIATMMDKMGLQEGEVIQAGMMSKAIEKAQKKVEENHFGVRKRLLEYDDVMNSQRTVIYTQRRHALHGERVEIDLNNMMLDFADTFVENTQGADFEDFSIELIRQVAMQPTFDEATYNKASKEELAQLIVEDLRTAYARRAQVVAQTAMPVLKNVIEKQGDQVETLFVPITNGTLVYNVATNLKRAVESDGAEIYKMFTKLAMLTTIDDNWREHLRAMDDLKQSVQNASYEQKDPLLIYKLEAYNLFRAMIDKINREVLSILLKGYIPTRENANDRLRQRQQNQQKVDVNKLQASRMAAAAAAGQGEKSRPMPVHVEKKVRPNDPCPCGSGKKYKHCHGA